MKIAQIMNFEENHILAKNTPLVKPFTLCLTDKYFVDVVGSLLANKNDAGVIKDELENNMGFKNLLQKEDTFILNRGYQDIVKDLEANDFKNLIPSLKGPRKQLTAVKEH